MRNRMLCYCGIAWVLTLAVAAYSQTPTAQKPDEPKPLYYGTAYSPEEEQLLQQAIRDLSLADKRQETLKQLTEAGYVVAEVPYGDALVVCLIPPSLLCADHSLVLLNALLALAQYPLQQPVRWSDLSEEAQQAVLLLLETQMPYDAEQRQWVYSHLDEVEISLKYTITLTDKDQNPVAFYDPPSQRSVKVPAEALQWRAHGLRPQASRVMRRSGRGVEMLSEPVDLNRLEQLRERVYEHAVAYVREQNRKAYLEVLEAYLKPLRSGIEEWIGKQVEAQRLNPEWLTQRVREVGGIEGLVIRDGLEFCLKRRALPSEKVRRIESCIPINEMIVGRDSWARD